MRRMTARRIVMTGLAVAVALAARPAWTAEKAPNDRLLPPNTYLYLTVPNVGRLKSRFGKSHIGQLLKEPKLQDFLGDVKKKLAELGEEFEKNVGLKLDDVLAIPDGEASVAVLLPDRREKARRRGDPRLQQEQQLNGQHALLDKAAAGLEKEGFKKTTRDVQGSQMVVYTQGEG